MILSFSLIVISLFLVFTVRSWSPVIFGYRNPKRLSLKDFQKSEKEVFWRMVFFQYEGDVLTEKAYFDGYALCLTDLPNESRTVDLLFFSEKEVWSVPATSEQYRLISQTDDRLDNFNLFMERFREYNFPVTARYGFAADFSTLGMPNGTYELGFRVVENDEDKGFSRTGLFFQKKNRNFYLIPSPDIVIEEFSPDKASSDGVSGQIEHVQLLGNGSCLIEGWISVDGYAEDEGRVIIEITDSRGYRALFQPDQNLERLIPGKEGSVHNNRYHAIIPPTAGFSGEIIIRAFIQMPDGNLFMAHSDRSLVL